MVDNLTGEGRGERIKLNRDRRSKGNKSNAK